MAISDHINTTTVAESIFAQAAHIANKATGKAKRASWKGVLSLILPALGLNNVLYHVKGAKSEIDKQELNIVKVHRESRREVEAKEVIRYYRYTETATGERENLTEVPYEALKTNVRYELGDGKHWKITAKNEKRYFDKQALLHGVKVCQQCKNTVMPAIDGTFPATCNGCNASIADIQPSLGFVEVDPSQLVDLQDGQEEVSKFDRTKVIEIGEDGTIPLSRVSEYKMKEIYMLKPDADANETVQRIRDLARLLMEKQVALIGFFSWGNGFNFYTCVIYPYERQDGSLWLLMGMAEGRTQYDPTWALNATGVEEKAVPMVQAPPKSKPKVRLSK